MKKLPAMQQMRVGSLGWEDPLEKDMATTLVFLPRRSHERKKPGGLQSMGLQRVGHDRETNASIFMLGFIPVH